MDAVKAAESIDQHISKFMTEQKLGVGEMAGLLGMTPNSLRWKRQGKQDWKWSEVLKLADLFGMSVDQLIGRKEQ